MHNLPDDIHLTANDPRNPLYNDRRDAAQERVTLQRREDIIDCIVKGYSETDDGDTVPLLRFAEYVVDSSENETGMYMECWRLLLWTIASGDSNSEEVEKLRRQIACHFVYVEGL